jgi:hypothetical protein
LAFPGFPAKTLVYFFVETIASHWHSIIGRKKMLLLLNTSVTFVEYSYHEPNHRIKLSYGN